ncbi:MAG: DUF4358 domain-containing protein [Clostridiales bacterium]|nr:DUF4358 domain-containing protein [Clostridiales bacterium]
MKIKTKVYLSALSFILAAIVLCSCSRLNLLSKKTIFEPDSPKQVAQKIFEVLEEYDFIKLSKESVALYYDFDLSLCESCLVYISNKENSADEIAIFNLKDNESNESVISAIKQRAEIKKQTYQSINSSEYEKANTPILINNNNYIVYVVSSQSKEISSKLNDFYS